MSQPNKQSAESKLSGSVKNAGKGSQQQSQKEIVAVTPGADETFDPGMGGPVEIRSMTQDEAGVEGKEGEATA